MKKVILGLLAFVSLIIAMPAFVSADSEKETNENSVYVASSDVTNGVMNIVVSYDKSALSQEQLHNFNIKNAYVTYNDMRHHVLKDEETGDWIAAPLDRYRLHDPSKPDGTIVVDNKDEGRQLILFVFAEPPEDLDAVNLTVPFAPEFRVAIQR